MCWKRPSVLRDLENRLPVALQHPRAQAFRCHDFVVMASVAGPAGHEAQRHFSGVHHSMCDVTGYVVQAARLHVLSPRASRLIAQHEHSFTRGSAVELPAINNGVAVPVRHEIFITHASRLNLSPAPEQSTFSAGRHSLPPPDPVDYGVGVHPVPGLLVVKYFTQLAELFFRGTQPGNLQSAGAPIDGCEGGIHESRLAERHSEINPKDHKFVRFVCLDNKFWRILAT